VSADRFLRWCSALVVVGVAAAALALGLGQAFDGARGPFLAVAMAGGQLALLGLAACLLVPVGQVVQRVVDRLR
jgi:hypothetical protein